MTPWWMRLYNRLFRCPRVGHAPSLFSTRPICVHCHGTLPGVWGFDD